MSIALCESEIIEEFSVFDEWLDKYEYIIDLGKELESLDDQFKTPENIIKGCQSQVWLHAEMNDGKIHFIADSDAIITKGIVGLLIRVLSNQKPNDILNAELSFIGKIGLQEHLSPTRSNGLVAMIKQMKIYAMAFQTQLR